MLFGSCFPHDVCLLESNTSTSNTGECLKPLGLTLYCAHIDACDGAHMKQKQSFHSYLKQKRDEKNEHIYEQKNPNTVRQQQQQQQHAHQQYRKFLTTHFICQVIKDQSVNILWSALYSYFVLCFSFVDFCVLV